MQTCNIHIRKKLPVQLFFVLYAMHVSTVSLHAMFRYAQQQTHKVTRDDIKKDLAFMFFNPQDIENGSWVSKPCRPETSFSTSFTGYSPNSIQYLATIGIEQSLALQPSKNNIKNLQQQKLDLFAKITLLQKIAGLGSRYFVQQPKLKKPNISPDAMLDRMAHHITNIQPINRPQEVIFPNPFIYTFSHDPQYMYACQEIKQARITYTKDLAQYKKDLAHHQKCYRTFKYFYEPLKKESESIAPDYSSQSTQDHPLKKPIVSNFNTLRKRIKREVVLSNHIAQLKEHKQMWEEKAVVHTLATTAFITSITCLCATYLLNKK